VEQEEARGRKGRGKGAGVVPERRFLVFVNHHSLTHSQARRLQVWPLKDILSLLGFGARINHLFIASPTCIAHTVAVSLQY